MSGTAQDARHVAAMARLNAVNVTAATAISMLTLISVWGDWHKVAMIVGYQIALVPFNVWINLSVLKKRGVAFSERLRGGVNMVAGLVTSHLIGWPVPVFLWLPFIALAFDPVHPRVSYAMTAGACVAYLVFPLLAGVPWLVPVSLAVIALFAGEISKIRSIMLREMLVEADAQRAELERARAELEAANARLVEEMKARAHAELELRHAQKLEAVGRLASGIAHEINTPVQYVSDSVHFLRDAMRDLLALVDAYRARGVLEEAEREADLAYLSENVPSAFETSVDGLERISKIVRSMKDFAHPHRTEMTSFDLNQGILSTLTIAKGEYKYVAEAVTELGELPPVTCHGGDVNQVVLNLLVNAAHAIGDVVKGSSDKGLITVKTWRDGGDACISISDTGGGIPEETRDRIFEPFFTTKAVGKGTGQGLSIARSVIVEKHGGSLTFDSEVGRGTTFEIRLPIEPPKPQDTR